MRLRRTTILPLVLLGACTAGGASPTTPHTPAQTVADPPADPVNAFASQTVQQGRAIFRFDTFGSESFWGD